MAATISTPTKTAPTSIHTLVTFQDLPATASIAQSEREVRPGGIGFGAHRLADEPAADKLRGESASGQVSATAFQSG